jgi:hypothetical protein
VGGQKDLVNVFRCRRSVPHSKLRVQSRNSLPAIGLHVVYDFQSVILVRILAKSNEILDLIISSLDISALDRFKVVNRRGFEAVFLAIVGLFGVAYSIYWLVMIN